ncbi:beta-lactamase family protein [candidate division KSB1 bacterium]|nr:beta-lactamase family protein [candidate division KSB1 bacterium]
MKRTAGTVAVILIIFFAFCEKEPTGPKIGFFKWDVAIPESQGMRSQMLDSAAVQAAQKSFVDGLLVIRNGYIVAEHYYNGYNETKAHNVMSVSKSFLSAMTGIALDEGYIDSLDHKMLEYFPEYISSGLDPRKYQITIRHLLTMRMGIAPETDNYFDIYNSRNWLKTTIEFPLTYTPGEKMRYNTFQTHLLSAIIAKASDMSTLEFARKYLTDPMGITIDGWEQDPQGYYFGGNSMVFTPREMAVLGYLYLNNGKLNDQQIVPSAWVALSLLPTTSHSSTPWGVLNNHAYGYLWWLGQINNYDVFMALGHGGQTVLTFPELNLIVVTTANNLVDLDTADSQECAVLEIVSRYVLPAIK